MDQDGRPKRGAEEEEEDPSLRQRKRGRGRRTGSRSSAINVPQPGGPSANRAAGAQQLTDFAAPETAPRRGRGSRGRRRRGREVVDVSAVERPIDVRAEAAVKIHKHSVVHGQIQHEPEMRDFGPDSPGFMDTPARFSELPGPLDAAAAALSPPSRDEPSLDLSLRALQRPPPDPSLVAAAIRSAQELSPPPPQNVSNSPPPEDPAV